MRVDRYVCLPYDKRDINPYDVQSRGQIMKFEISTDGQMTQAEFDTPDVAPKAPRKPRPSEVAAKKAKALARVNKVKAATDAKIKKGLAGKAQKSKSKARTAKKKPAGSKVKVTKKTKAKTKTKPAKKAKAAKKPVRKSKPAKKASASVRPLVRTARVDLKLTPQEKKKLVAVAKKRDMTVTALLVKLITSAK